MTILERIHKNMYGKPLNEDVTNTDIKISKGDIFYHGTSEPIQGNLRIGGYDSILWTSKNELIARSYIPIGGRFNISNDLPVRLRFANKYDIDNNNYTLAFFGLEIPEESFKLDDIGKVSYYILPKSHPFYGKSILDKLKLFDDILQNKFGLTPEKVGDLRLYDGDKYHTYPEYQYRIITHNNKIQHGGQYIKGKLYKLVAKEDLLIHDYRKSTESDLTNLEYHDLDGFNKINSLKKYDGILINDFAQSDSFGNIAHISFGFFKDSINKFSYSFIESSHPTREELTF